MAALPEQYIAPAGDVDARIADALADAGERSTIDLLEHLRTAGLDRLDLPGRGATLRRWRALEAVARHDLSLVKWYESHVDALAILADVEPQRSPSPWTLYAVWASESRVDPIVMRPTRSADVEQVVIDGRKSWCSGAGFVDAGLMTAIDARGDRYLVEVRMDAPGIVIDASRWQAVGMAGSGSHDIVCSGVAARRVGPAGAYLDRPGFWHGGAGVAACWYGAAAAIGTRVRDLQRGRDDVHALAHLGAIDAALASGAALLRETAAQIDADPTADAMRIALRVRGAIADLCEIVIHHAGRAIGPGPLCNEGALARRVADLPIFVRQSRTEHDRVAQARALLDDPDEPAAGWSL